MEGFFLAFWSRQKLYKEEPAGGTRKASLKANPRLLHGI